MVCASTKTSFNGVCSSSCGSGFSSNPTTKQCYCPPGYYVNGNICTGKFHHFCQQRQVKLLACSIGCSGCFSVSASACYSCSPSALPPKYLLSNTCSATCPSGKYIDSDAFFCVSCDVSCVACSGAGNTNCVGGCQSGYYQQPAPATSTCLDTCPPNYYKDNSLKKCLPCHANCQTCTGPSKSSCSACTPGKYFLSPSSCIEDSECPSSHYPDTITESCIRNESSFFAVYNLSLFLSLCLSMQHMFGRHDLPYLRQWLLHSTSSICRPVFKFMSIFLLS